MGFKVGDISTEAPKLPNRIILHGLAGWGKTSFAAHAPGVVFLLVGQETGLWTLMESGGASADVLHFPTPAASVANVIQACHSLIDDKHDHKALCIDSITALDSLIQADVCEKRFKGDWTEFYAYGGDQASKLTALAWEPLLNRFEQVRGRGLSVLLLSHSRVVNFKNPSGTDYERWESLTKHTWARLTMWADMVLFGGYDQVVVKRDKRKNEAEGKGKAVADAVRVLYTERRGAFDAKNRHGLPAEISCGESSAEAWANFREALTKER